MSIGAEDSSQLDSIMIYIGIDIGKSKHCIAAINHQANTLIKPTFVPQNAHAFQNIHASIEALTTDTSQVKIGIEASGHYWGHFHRFLIQKGWTVELINPVLSAAQGRQHLRGRKTDKDDAITIAKTLRDGGYEPWSAPTPQGDALKKLCRQRDFTITELSNAKRRLTALLDQSFPELAAFFSDPYGKAPVQLLRHAPSADTIASLSTRKIAAILREASRKRHGIDKARKLHQAAINSVARGYRCHALETSITLMLDQIEFLQKQTQTLDTAIARTYTQLTQEHPLQKLPGIGKVTAPTIIAEYGDLQRFHGGYKTLQAYAGLDPRIRESGQWKGTVRMSKRGSPALRTALYKAASMGRLHCPQLQEIYEKHRHQKGKNHHVAISHVARKLIQLIWAVWRNNAPYDPQKINPKPA